MSQSIDLSGEDVCEGSVEVPAKEDSITEENTEDNPEKKEADESAAEPKAEEPADGDGDEGTAGKDGEEPAVETAAAEGEEKTEGDGSEKPAEEGEEKLAEEGETPAEGEENKEGGGESAEGGGGEEEPAVAEAPPEVDPVAEKKSKAKSRPSTAASNASVECKKSAGGEQQDIKEVEVEDKFIEFAISCRNLKNKDFLSKSDPMAVVMMKKKDEENWSEVGRTEMILDDLNPDFITKVMLEVNPDKDDVEVPLKFIIYDVDKPGQTEVHETDILGLVEVNLAEVLAGVEADNFFNIDLRERGNSEKVVGSMHLEVEQLSGSVRDTGEKLFLKLSGKNIFQGKGLFTPKLFYILGKKNPKSGNFTYVYRSEEFKGKEPVWANRAVLDLSTLCNGDRDRELKIDVYSEKSMKETHKPIAYAFSSLNGLLEIFSADSKKPAHLSPVMGIGDGKEIPNAVVIINECVIGH